MKIVAQFCGGYLLDDGSLVLEEQPVIDDEDCKEEGDPQPDSIELNKGCSE